jgi:hypothetical protein
MTGPGFASPHHGAEILYVVSSDCYLRHGGNSSRYNIIHRHLLQRLCANNTNACACLSATSIFYSQDSSKGTWHTVPTHGCFQLGQLGLVHWLRLPACCELSEHLANLKGLSLLNGPSDGLDGRGHSLQIHLTALLPTLQLLFALCRFPLFAPPVRPMVLHRLRRAWLFGSRDGHDDILPVEAEEGVRIPLACRCGRRLTLSGFANFAHAKTDWTSFFWRSKKSPGRVKF